MPSSRLLTPPGRTTESCVISVFDADALDAGIGQYRPLKYIANVAIIIDKYDNTDVASPLAAFAHLQVEI